MKSFEQIEREIRLELLVINTPLTLTEEELAIDFDLIELRLEELEIEEIEDIRTPVTPVQQDLIPVDEDIDWDLLEREVADYFFIVQLQAI